MVIADSADIDDKKTDPSISSTPSVGTPTGGPSPSGAPASSGQYTNLQKYLDANKDFGTDHEGLADNVGGVVRSQAQGIEGGLKDLQNTFDQGASQGEKSYQGGQNTVDQAIADPTGYLGSGQQALSKFDAAKDATYSGPTGLGSEALSGDAQNLHQTTQNAQTENGRYGLLQSMFSSPGYNYGEQKLDNVFLQNDPNLSKVVSDGSKTAAKVSQDLTSANAAAAQRVGNDVNQAQDIRNYAAQKLGLGADGSVDLNSNGALPSLINSVTRRMGGGQAAYDTALSDLNNNKLTSADWSTLGLDPTSYGHVYMPMSRFKEIAASLPAQANPSNIATAAEAANYQALAKLAGITPTFITDPSQAGAFGRTIANNGQALAQTVADNKKQFEADVQRLANEANQMISTVPSYARGVTGTTRPWDNFTSLDAPSLKAEFGNPGVLESELMQLNGSNPLDLNYPARQVQNASTSGITSDSPLVDPYVTAYQKDLQDIINTYGLTDQGISDPVFNPSQPTLAKILNGAPTTAQGGMVR